MGKIKEVFKEWAKDNEVVKQFAPYEIIGSKILIRLFLYRTPKEERKIIIPDDVPNIIGIDKSKLKDSEAEGGAKDKITCFAKVLKLGTMVGSDYAELKPGDIVSVPDNIMNTSINPDWLYWKEQGGHDSRPQNKNPEPPKFIGNIATWRDFIFMADKFNDKMSVDDALTFLIPQNQIISKVNIDELF